MKFIYLIEMITTASDSIPTDNFPVNKFPLVTKKLKKKLKKVSVIRRPTLYTENLNLAKFHYTNWKHDKTPKVKILDYHYEGKPNEKKKTDHILGWNINYYINKKEAIDTIDDIDSFARMISANKLEKYKRIKYFFPDQADLIRRYKKEVIKNLKTKETNDWFYKKTSLDALEQKDKENF